MYSAGVRLTGKEGSGVVCVSCRPLFPGSDEEYLTHLFRLAAAHPAALLLREKERGEEDYLHFAEKILAKCADTGTRCILHTHFRAAIALRTESVHLPLPVLRTLSEKEKASFSILGASCHSLDEALEAEKLGCTYLFAGHVFDTDCKRGTPGRGLPFLKEICRSVKLPVYAIGGVTPQRTPDLLKAGCAGVCVMSGAMTCGDPDAYLSEFPIPEVKAK